MGLVRVTSFEQISSDPEVQERLASIYADADQVDAWVGGLAEDPLPLSHVGELNQAILVDQFEALRMADRLWYEKTFSRWGRWWLEHNTLHDVIRRNSDIGPELQLNVFQAKRQ